MSKQPFKLTHTDVYTLSFIAGILLRVSEKYLKFLASCAINKPSDKVFEFIEAQAWGELYLHQDVKAIVISEQDLKKMETETSRDPEFVPPAWLDLNPKQRQKKIAKLRTMLENFCAEHKIQLYYLALDKNTMNLTAPRPPGSEKKLASVAQGSSNLWYMVSPGDRARIGLDRLNALTVGTEVSVVDPETDRLLARGTVTWEHGVTMTVRFDDVLVPKHHMFSFGGEGSELRFDKGSENIKL
jgi:hypothetical protein